MKRLLTLVLALLMLLSLLSAASFAQEENLEFLELDWIVFGGSDPPVAENTAVQQAIEERFNVKINPSMVNSGDNDQFTLFFASGETADHIVVYSGTQYEMLVEQQLVREIDLDMILGNMPVWMEKIYTLAGSKELVDQQMPWKDGKYYGIPYLHAAIMESGLMLIREDWLDNVGLEIPTTLDELYEVLYAFTYDDPDQNGQDDTYGINGNGRYHFNYVYGAYGIMPATYDEEDGVVSYTGTSEAYKEVLKLLSDWYKEGLIDPETFTDDRTKQREKWAAGKFGVLPDNAFWADSARGNVGVVGMVTEQNPDARVVGFAAVAGPDGLAGSQLDYTNSMGQGVIVFGADTSDEKVERIMLIKETFASDYEFYKSCQYGIEGKNYELYDGGRIRVLDNSDVKDVGYGQIYSIQPQSFEEYTNASTAEDEEFHHISLTQPYIFVNRSFYIAEENVAATEMGADVRSIFDEYNAQAIMGLVDIDATWDNYVDRLNAAGLSKIIQEYEALLAK